jgi:hypothetical protein
MATRVYLTRSFLAVCKHLLEGMEAIISSGISCCRPELVPPTRKEVEARKNRFLTIEHRVSAEVDSKLSQVIASTLLNAFFLITYRLAMRSDDMLNFGRSIALPKPVPWPFTSDTGV